MGKKKTLPADIEKSLKIIKQRYFKDDTLTTVKNIFMEIVEKEREEYSDKDWGEKVFYKRAFHKLKNSKKREKLGGSVDPYYIIPLGASKIRDLSSKRRADILEKWDEDPQQAIDDDIILTRRTKNPETGEEEKIPIYDDEGDIIPADNNEFFEWGEGNNKRKWKNPNFGNALGKTLRKVVIGATSNMQGVKGIALVELRDKQTKTNIPMNKLCKCNLKTNSSSVVVMESNKFISKETVEGLIEFLQMEIETGTITEEYLNERIPYFERLIPEIKEENKNKKPEEIEFEETEVNVFKLRSSRGTSFIEASKKGDYEKSEFPVNSEGIIDIDMILKEYFYPFSSDCASLFDFHIDSRYIGGDPEKINWDEFVVLQDVNLIQVSHEASLSGNYPLYVEDDSLLWNEVEHNGEIVDSIRVLVPSHIKIDYGQDSKLTIIGTPFQVQAQDDDRKPLFTEEEVEDEKTGKTKTIKVPIMDYPMILAYGAFAIPEFKVEVETIDLTFVEDEIDIETTSDSEKKEEKPKPETKKPKTKPTTPKKSGTKPKTPKKETKEDVETTEETISVTPEEESQEEELDDENIW